MTNLENSGESSDVQCGLCVSDGTSTERGITGAPIEVQLFLEVLGHTLISSVHPVAQQIQECRLVHQHLLLGDAECPGLGGPIKRRRAKLLRVVVPPDNLTTVGHSALGLGNILADIPGDVLTTGDRGHLVVGIQILEVFSSAKNGVNHPFNTSLHRSDGEVVVVKVDVTGRAGRSRTDIYTRRCNLSHVRIS